MKLSSLDYPVLQRVRELDPELEVGMIITAKIGNAFKLDVDFFSVAQKRAVPAFIRRAHARDREVHAWTVNSKKNLQLMMDRGVDNVITDYPARADARTNRDDLRGVLVRLFDK